MLLADTSHLKPLFLPKVFLGFRLIGTLPVLKHVSLSLCGDELKLGTLHVEIEVRRVSHLHDVHFQSVVSPGTELQFTHLVIKREVSDVDITTAAKNCGREPGTSSIRSQDDFGFEHIQSTTWKQLLRANKKRFRKTVQSEIIRDDFRKFVFWGIALPESGPMTREYVMPIFGWLGGYQNIHHINQSFMVLKNNEN